VNGAARRDDCIIAINGKEVRRIKDVMDALYANGLRVGTAIDFTVLRDYELDPVHVRLVTAPKYELELYTPTLKLPAVHVTAK
jgi:S1-C subfamily serine protease